MMVRPLSIEFDFPVLQSFWVEKGLPLVPKEYLPPIGISVDHDGELICGGFLAKDSKVGSIGYIAANPFVDKNIRSKALDLLLLSLEQMATSKGCRVVTVSTNVPALQARYEAHAYKLTDQNVNHYVKEI